MLTPVPTFSEVHYTYLGDSDNCESYVQLLYAAMPVQGSENHAVYQEGSDISSLGTTPLMCGEIDTSILHTGAIDSSPHAYMTVLKKNPNSSIPR